MNTILVNKEKSKRTSVKFSFQSMLMLMATIMMALVTLTSCFDDDENGTDSDNPNSYPEKAAVKYRQVHLEGTVHHYVVFDNYGQRYREDWWGPIEAVSQYDHWETEIENHINKTRWESIYKGTWTDLSYKTEKKFEITFTNVEKTLSNGFKKQPNQITLAGKPCDIYTLTLSLEGRKYDYTYAIWNNIEMMYETKESESGKIIGKREAEAVTLDVPEVAFTKTLDITWLPK